jgi:hypothetical protein
MNSNISEISLSKSSAKLDRESIYRSTSGLHRRKIDRTSALLHTGVMRVEICATLLYPFWELTMKMQGNIAESLLSEDSNSRSYKSEKVYNQNGETLLHRPTETREHDEDSAPFNVLPAFDNILSRLEASKDREDPSPHLCTCTNLAWIKMTEYYKKTDIAKVYLVAAELDPRLKMKYFEDNLGKSGGGTGERS